MFNKEKLIGIYKYTAEHQPVYLLNIDKLKSNYQTLLDSFSRYYPNTRIAYSYKTNYDAHVCKCINDMGGYAEVVSGNEADYAIRSGVNTGDIIFNGVTGDEQVKAYIATHGGKVNIDSLESAHSIIKNLDRAKRLTGTEAVKLGIRIEVCVGSNSWSRFGVSEDELPEVISLFEKAGIHIAGLHCHAGGSRDIDSWIYRANKMLETADKVEAVTGRSIEYIDLGGHLYGDMDEQLKSQFYLSVPTFKEYGKAVGELFKDKYGDSGPQLILEPGTALVGDAFSILATVNDVKDREPYKLATLDVSSRDCGMVAECKNLTIENLSRDEKEIKGYKVFGYTCMEQDYINREYYGELRKGDIVRILNAGAYSSSLKGAFIKPGLKTIVVNDNMDVVDNGQAEED